jgi:hypothetical protein
MALKNSSRMHFWQYCPTQLRHIDFKGLADVSGSVQISQATISGGGGGSLVVCVVGGVMRSIEVGIGSAGGWWRGKN